MIKKCYSMQKEKKKWISADAWGPQTQNLQNNQSPRWFTGTWMFREQSSRLSLFHGQQSNLSEALSRGQGPSLRQMWFWFRITIMINSNTNIYKPLCVRIYHKVNIYVSVIYICMWFVRYFAVSVEANVVDQKKNPFDYLLIPTLGNHCRRFWGFKQ